jgi:predicted patatin/cPLA2 family phospholipase
MSVLEDALSESRQGYVHVGQGGGLGGFAYHVGVNKFLSEQGVLPYMVEDISSSAARPAMTGALFGKQEHLDEILDILITPEVVSIKRFIKGGPLLDVGHIVNKLAAPLCIDAEAFQSHSTTLHYPMACTDSDKLEEVIMTNRDGHEQLQMLEATISIPIVWDRKVKIGGMNYVDGGILSQIPHHHAPVGYPLLVVLTEPLTHSPGPDFKERAFLEWYRRKRDVDSRIVRAVEGRYALFELEYTAMKKRMRPQDVLIQPSRPLPAGVVTKDRYAMRATERQGYIDAMKQANKIENMVSCSQAA